MKLHSVFQDDRVMRGDMWFRPIGWVKGCGAYCVKNGATCYVPTKTGGQESMTCDVKILSGDWEIVSVDDVLN